MVLLRYGGASFVWGLLLGKAPMSYALQDFLVSLFQHLLERYVENLLINRAEGKKTKIQTRIVYSEAYVCNSVLSPDEVTMEFCLLYHQHWSMLWQWLHNCRTIT